MAGVSASSGRRVVFRGDKKTWKRYLKLFTGIDPYADIWSSATVWPDPQLRICPVIAGVCDTVNDGFSDYYGCRSVAIHAFGVSRPVGSYVSQEVSQARLLRLINIGVYRWVATLLDIAGDNYDIRLLGYDCVTNLPQFKTLSDAYIFAERAGREMDYYEVSRQHEFASLGWFLACLRNVTDMRYLYRVANEVADWCTMTISYRDYDECDEGFEKVYRNEVITEQLLPVLAELLSISPRKCVDVAPYGGEGAFAARLETYWW